MITEFGKSLRKLRIDNGEVLAVMAKKLGVSSSFLSAVEVGKKNVPSTWIEKIVTEYKLPSDKAKELSRQASDAVTSVKVNLKDSSNIQREAALVFARDFGNLSDTDASKILDYFNKSSEEE